MEKKSLINSRAAAKKAVLAKTPLSAGTKTSLPGGRGGSLPGGRGTSLPGGKF